MSKLDDLLLEINTLTNDNWSYERLIVENKRLIKQKKTGRKDIKQSLILVDCISLEQSGMSLEELIINSEEDLADREILDPVDFIYLWMMIY